MENQLIPNSDAELVVDPLALILLDLIGIKTDIQKYSRGKNWDVREKSQTALRLINDAIEIMRYNR